MRRIPPPSTALALVCLLVLVASVGSARAASGSPRWVLEFGPYAGHYDFDALTGFEDFAVFGARLGARMSPWLRIEGSFDEVYTSRSGTDNSARQVSFGLHARIEPWSTRLAPYLLAGGAFVILDDAEDPDAWGEALDVGLGARWNWRERWLLRAEWMLRRQNFQLWRAVDDGNGGTVLDGEAVTLWGRSLRVGISHVF